eukprot:COSAG01_NODE_56_length_31088_cov_39.354771_7_plen_143_part_00
MGGVGHIVPCVRADLRQESIGLRFVVQIYCSHFLVSVLPTHSLGENKLTEVPQVVENGRDRLQLVGVLVFAQVQLQYIIDDVSALPSPALSPNGYITLTATRTRTSRHLTALSAGGSVALALGGLLLVKGTASQQAVGRAAG